jgi:hypothetical protein
MASWMKKLARHYDKMRARYPEDDLLILFDIDGTILDMRYMVLHVLRRFDEAHETDYFENLTLETVDVHENQVDLLLDHLHVPRPQRERVHNWYLKHRWSPAAILDAHRPFRGVMEVVRWFQIQPRTSVGLNTGRPEDIREETLRSLNELGKEYRVEFSNDLLFMNPGQWEEDVDSSKVAGVRHFQKAGHRVIAMVDNEPDNLTAIADSDEDGDILLLHANTIFETTRSGLPAGSAGGADYDITELISEKALPRHVQFVWHGLNDEANIRQFLASNIHWAEFDVRRAPDGTLVLRHDSLDETPFGEDEELLYIDAILERLEKFDKSIKLDLKEGGEVIDRIIEIVRGRQYPHEKLWLNAVANVLGEDGFRRLAAAFPGAVVQCPMDFLAPLIGTLPEEGKRILDQLAGWGINRFSVSWDLPNLPELLGQMDAWGFEVNIYNVPDLESFLKAVLHQPRSITSDFNFPQWYYYGRGSGEKAQRYEYGIKRPAPHSGTD